MTEAELLGFTKGRGQRKERSRPWSSSKVPACVPNLLSNSTKPPSPTAARMSARTCEWKEQCFASCVSCSGFFANSIRMIFAAFFYQMMEKTRRNLLPSFWRVPLSASAVRSSPTSRVPKKPKSF